MTILPHMQSFATRLAILIAAVAFAWGASLPSGYRVCTHTFERCGSADELHPCCESEGEVPCCLVVEEGLGEVPVPVLLEMPALAAVDLLPSAASFDLVFPEVLPGSEFSVPDPLPLDGRGVLRRCERLLV